MRENGRRLVRYDLLVVSLLSSLDCELVSGFLCLVLALFGCFLGWMALEKALKEMVRFWKLGLDSNQCLDHHLIPPFFHSNLLPGNSLPKKDSDLMEPNPLNTRFCFESRLCWLSRLASMEPCGKSSDGSMNSVKQDFLFSSGNGSASVGKILLVEDTEINRILLRKLFRDLNLLLEEAENGQIAVDYFKQGKNYDLVLMDKEMPVMDGHEATRQLRSLGVKTPIIALTGNSLQSDKDLFFQAGADEFRTKPLTRDELIRLLARYGLDNPAPGLVPDT